MRFIPTSGIRKPRSRGRSAQKPLWKRRDFWKKVGYGAAIFAGFFVLTAAWFIKDLPGPKGIKKSFAAANSIIYDRHGKEIAQLRGDENRKIISFEQLPENVKNATVAIEDKDFYKHGGFDVLAILRAAYYDLRYRELAQGGSTITQQLIKNAVLTGERSFWRKYKELVMAIEMELLYSKDEILMMYLNEVPYGSQAYGVEAAAQTFFKKSAKDLDQGIEGIAQSALLAGLPRAPSLYNPYYGDRDLAIARQHRILDLMVAQGFITAEQSVAAKAFPVLGSDSLNPSPLATGNPAPHFTQFVRQQLVEKFGEKKVDQGGLRVETSLDLELQKSAQEIVTERTRSNGRLGASNAALVAADPKTGEILAMVGSADFGNQEIQGNVNVATSQRQPGSSFKPFAYATAFKKNFFPGSTLFDLRTDFGGGYRPQNYNLREYGPVSMRQALANSLNVSAVKTLYLAGIDDTIDTAHDLGITTLQDRERYGLSLVLGGGEVKLTDMVAAYGTFANQGERRDQIAVRKVIDQGGKTLWENKPKGREVLDEQIAYLVTDVLADNRARSMVFGSRSALNLGNRPAAAKTGTTESFRDAWTVGFTPSLVTGVWVGNADGSFMSRGADGSVVAAPIWRDFMLKALAGAPVEQFERPKGIKNLTVDSLTGKRPGEGSRETRTDIAASWTQVRSGGADAGKEFKIDKVSRKLATDLTPPAAIETIYSINLQCELPRSDPAYSRWQGPVSAWAASHGYGGVVIPTEYDDVHVEANRPSISITDPKSGDSETSPITVELNVKAPLEVDRVEVYLDGTLAATATGSGSKYTANIQASSGSHQITAKVFDKAFWDATSGSVSVTVTSSGPLSVPKPKPPRGRQAALVP